MRRNDAPTYEPGFSHKGVELHLYRRAESAWYYDAVKYVSDKGIMNGTGGTTFSPDVTVTRAMFVAMLGRLHGAEQKITDKFPDVTAAEKFDVTAYKDHLTTIDYEIVTPVAASKADVDRVLAEADAAAEAIINNSENIDTSKVTGTCYYISDSEGDDKNSGTSPDKPWKTFTNLYTIKGGGSVIINNVKPGDAVLLKRGDTFNYNSYPELKYNYIDAIPGVTYGTYGEGAKPVISREFVMNEPAGKWSSTQYKNVWKLDYEMNDYPGCIVFEKHDGTELWGIITVFGNPQAPYGTKSRPLGTVTNGEDTFNSGNVMFENPGSLKNNLEYFVDPDTDTLYVYYSG